jgi:hypothetical protein
MSFSSQISVEAYNRNGTLRYKHTYGDTLTGNVRYDVRSGQRSNSVRGSDRNLTLALRQTLKNGAFHIGIEAMTRILKEIRDSAGVPSSVVRLDKIRPGTISAWEVRIAKALKDAANGVDVRLTDTTGHYRPVVLDAAAKRLAKRVLGQPSAFSAKPAVESPSHREQSAPRRPEDMRYVSLMSPERRER